MIWQWPISSDRRQHALRVALACACLAGEAYGGTVTASVELVDSREPSVRKQRDFSGVVVWLEPVGPAHRLPALLKYTILQKGKRFSPHVLPVPLGATVEFPNLDPIFHNAFSNFAGQPFDVGLYPPGSSRAVHFRREGIVRVFCNIHSAMSAVILVMSTPHFAVSNATGQLRIENVPPGEYQLRVWHERAAKGTLAGLERRLVIGSDVALGTLRISESGYLEVPHKNKHGVDYPPTPPDAIIYPGVGR
jgi:hypothetical protein